MSTELTTTSAAELRVASEAARGAGDERLADRYELEADIAENGIARSRTGFAIGRDLLRIRNEKLYEAVGRLAPAYTTFESYAKRRWDYERSHCYRLIRAARVVEEIRQGYATGALMCPVGQIELLPQNEAQARELVPLLPALPSVDRDAGIAADHRGDPGYDSPADASGVLTAWQRLLDRGITPSGLSSTEIATVVRSVRAEQRADLKDRARQAHARAPAVKPASPIYVQPGDVFAIGNHRIACGDARDPNLVAALFGDLTADVLWTDPPYGVGYENGQGRTIPGDAVGDEELPSLLALAFLLADDLLSPGAPFYIAHAMTTAPIFREALDAVGWHYSETLEWVKDAMVLGHLDYQSRSEPILYGWKPGAPHRWVGGRDQGAVLGIGNHVDFGELFARARRGLGEAEAEGTAELDRAAARTLERARQEGSIGPLLEVTIRRTRSSEQDRDPPMKPVELIVETLANTVRRGDIVYDPFLGSGGSTLIGAEVLGCRGFGIELEPDRAQNAIEHVKAALGMEAHRAAVVDHESFDAVIRLWSGVDGYRAVMARARADLTARLDELTAAEQLAATMDDEFKEQLNDMGYHPADWYDYEEDESADQQQEREAFERMQRMRHAGTPRAAAAHPSPDSKSPPLEAPVEPTGNS